jgi:hypothetical protein
MRARKVWCTWWVLGRPGVFMNNVSDIDLIPLVLDAAARFDERPSGDEIQSLLSRRNLETLFVSWLV